MRVMIWLVGALLCSVLLLAAAPTQAQVSHVPQVAPQQQMVTISQSNYDDIMSRLTSLESTMLAEDDYKMDGGWEEVDILSKPTLKVSGRLHLDYWGVPGKCRSGQFPGRERSAGRPG